MPRQQRKSVTANTSVASRLPGNRPQAAAAVVDRFVAPNTKQSSLLSGLAKLSPGLADYLDAKKDEAIADDQLQAARDAELQAWSKPEVSEAIAKGELDPEKSPWYQQAYIKMRGTLAGQAKAREIQELYNNGGFDKDTGNLDDFFMQHLGESMQGIDDADFAGGFLESIMKAEGEIRDAQDNYNHVTITNETKSGLMSMAQELFLGHSTGGASAENQLANLEEFYRMGKENFFMSFQDIDAIVAQAVEQVADETGDDSIYDVLEQRKTNGTPGLFSNPKYASTLTAGRLRAQREEIAVQNAQHTLEQRARKERQEVIGKDIMEAFFNDDLTTAEALIEKNFATLDDEKLSTYRKMIKAERKALESDREVAQNDAAIRDVTVAILNGDITDRLKLVQINYRPEGGEGFISDKQDIRAAQTLLDKVMDRANVYQSENYKAAMASLKSKTQPFKAPDPLGLGGGGVDSSQLQRQGLAQREFFEKVSLLSENSQAPLTQGELMDIADEVAARYVDPESLKNSAAISQDSSVAPLYESPEETLAAYERGEITQSVLKQQTQIWAAAPN